MSDIIKLLPDSVANQIAAGEVIQRPASAIKELVENAIDAGATHVQIVLKDAGRTLMQIIDNGKGMTEADARMAFERHATSKISKAEDLFFITSKGFRGEALASIAAVAQVELRTKTEDQQLGTQILINGSVVESQTNVVCAKGSNFIVKNLFYNIPARRKFLKSDAVEIRNIITEFQRIALVEPDVAFSLTHNGELLYDLQPNNLRQRIVALFGKNYSKGLVEINASTSFVGIKGFIGLPEIAKRKSSDQYFFANQRYIKHPYFHRAVIDSYQNLLAPDHYPAYFIYIDVDTQAIDINIHPTKTEVKFEDETAIWPILMATVREALGKFNIAHPIDFDQDGAINIPVLTSETIPVMPTIQVDGNYNPFKTPSASFAKTGGGGASSEYMRESRQLFDNQKSMQGWESLFENQDQPQSPIETTKQPQVEVITSRLNFEEECIDDSDIYCFQLRNQYIVSSVRSGMMIIDQERAHTRILFEQFMEHIEKRKSISQKLLFADVISISPADMAIAAEVFESLTQIGFEFGKMANNEYEILAVPAELAHKNGLQLVDQVLRQAVNEFGATTHIPSAMVAGLLAKNASIKKGTPLTPDEMQRLKSNLFACKCPNLTPNDKTIVTILSLSEIDSRFK